MIKEQHIKSILKETDECGKCSIYLDIYPVGDDILAVLHGGDRPHIGCSVTAVPRESLTGDGSKSCTSSVINITGHKDDLVCRPVAEKLCAVYECNVICTGGIHLDGAGAEEIRDIQNAVERLLEEALDTDRT